MYGHTRYLPLDIYALDIYTLDIYTVYIYTQVRKCPGCGWQVETTDQWCPVVASGPATDPDTPLLTLHTLLLMTSHLHTWHTRIMSYQDTEYGRWLVGRVEARGRGVPRMVSRLCDVTVSNELLWPLFLLGTCYLSLRGVASKHNTDLNSAKISRSRGGGGRGWGW